MAVNEEKLFILKMLQDGKINSEEAARLIEAIDGSSKNTSSENTSRQYKQPPNFQDEVFKMKDKVKDWKKEFKQNYNQGDFDKAVEEFSTKAEKIGRNVATTTFGLVDRAIDFIGSFIDTNSFNVFGSYTAVDRTFETEAVEGMDINVEGINGAILVKKHLENKIIIKSRVRSPLNNADSILVFDRDSSSASLKLNKSSNVSVAHEVYLPVLKFGKIKLETTNGKIYVEDSISESFEGITKNSHIDLMGVNSDKIVASTKNARIQVSYVSGREFDINTSNSAIDIKHIKAEKMKASTTNGRILVENIQNYESSPEASLELKTTNSGIKVNMDDIDSRGYKVKAQTTNGGINLLIPGMTYNNVNRQGTGGSSVDAESAGYNDYPQKVYVTAETVNGYIEIVK